MPTHPDMTEEEKRQELARSKVARSQIAATPHTTGHSRNGCTVSSGSWC